MMPADLPARMPEQFRMTGLQVFNWGTFSGVHRVPISERGFLIVGRSGSGKSTLLDAFSALLIPPIWVDFNAAAREAERSGRDRSLVTYMRGAWGAQSDRESGATATSFLRTGTTWSALCLNYRNGKGQAVALVQVFWLRGNSNATGDVKRLFLVLERPFDLAELDAFGQSSFDVRQLKQQLGDAFVRDEFRPYRERFCRLLGIESDMALRLLHKTQSAKNVGDLNTFLRDFMLDKPETFAVAERLVSEFGELHAAHQAVVTAREQVQTLAPARARHQAWQAGQEHKAALERERQDLQVYRERLRMRLLAEAIAELAVQADGLEGRVRHQEALLANRRAVLGDLEDARRAAGGDQIEKLEHETRLLEEQREDRMRKRKQALEACRQLALDFKGSPEGFADLLGAARQELDAWQAGEGAHERLLQLDRERSAVRQARLAADAELASLRRQPSNIPAQMLALRRALAQAIGVNESALPFAGELLQVRPEASAWRAAAERILRGLALSIVVDERDYGALSKHVNDTDLGTRLVFLRANKAAEGRTAHLDPDSLVHKLEVRAGPFAQWLRQELHSHFHYRCCENLTAFRAMAERAVTREGLVKHNRSRHEKDDRYPAHDRSRWVLGFDNRDKLALFEAECARLAKDEARLDADMQVVQLQMARQGKRLLHCQTLINLQWQEVHVEPVLERINAIQRQLADIRKGNADLDAIDQRLGLQREAVNKAEQSLRQEGAALLHCREKAAELQLQATQLAADARFAPLPAERAAALDERFARLAAAPRLREVDQADRQVAAAIMDELRQAEKAIADGEKFIEASFARFCHLWQADADGLDPSMAAATDFFSKLARLETDGLPAHEQRFFELLQTQSHQNLAALSTYLSDGRKQILARMELVNDSLRQAPFNLHDGAPTYLQIQAKDRQLPEVKAFRQDLAGILGHAWNEDREQAETRFLALRRLVERLASQELEHRRWREAVLDVRLHVEFIGREYASDGEELDVHESGAGKSGGQRQKLATTVLAAALRYQLGGSESGVPIYAPVVLDEAFDKADNEFTALAMNIFTHFGFQMIVATPLKSVMTLEPFIGGACFVDIRDRRASGVLLIDYDEAGRRLDLPSQVRDEAISEASA